MGDTLPELRALNWTKILKRRERGENPQMAQTVGGRNRSKEKIL
jgi:hypothetical protein